MDSTLPPPAPSPAVLDDPPPAQPRSFLGWLFAPRDVATLALFRILFGAIMVYEVWRYTASDWIRVAYIEPDYHFTYYGFSWVRPWPGEWMYVHFLIVGVSALFVLVGLCYRLSALVLFLSFTYWFLLDQARYLNHFYLVCLISFLMIFLPAHRALSLDALIRRSRRSDDAPAWALFLMKAQLCAVYFYAALAKLNGDWLRGEPVRMWLARRDDYSLLGPWLRVGRFFREEWFVYGFAYGGLLFDLLIAPALLWRRSRPFALPFLVLFHLTNHQLFDIGIFPWFMLASTVLFFEPSWPRRIFNWPRGESRGLPSTFRSAAAPAARSLVATALGAYLAVQVLVPLRHFLYPGVVHWTEEGHRFAWHMKLRNKTSHVRISVVDAGTGRREEVRLGRFLTARQIRKMGARPDMALQFCHFLAETYRASGMSEVEVYADIEASLNGRPYQQLIDPAINLAAEPRTLLRARFILPLTTPLPPPDPSGRPEIDRDEE